MSKDSGNKRAEAEVRAEKKYGEKRKGTPTFSAVRMDSTEDLNNINDVINDLGEPRKEALMKAFTLLREKVKKSSD